MKSNLIRGGLLVVILASLAVVVQQHFVDTSVQAPSTIEQELVQQFYQAKKNDDITSALLLLKLMVDDAVRKGTQAPDYNLCNFTVRRFPHLFCEDNRGIARVDMPQMNGKPIPGSKADTMPRNSRGEVDGANYFEDYIQTNKGYMITEEVVPLTSLKATQKEIIGSKVAGIWLAMQNPQSPTYKAITQGYFFVSKDNYILDGHHRWAAFVARAISDGNLDSAMVKVKRVDVGIDQLVKDANQFTKDFGIQVEPGFAS